MEVLPCHGSPSVQPTSVSKELLVGTLRTALHVDNLWGLALQVVNPMVNYRLGMLSKGFNTRLYPFMVASL